MSGTKSSGGKKVIIITAIVLAALVALWAAFPLLNIPLSHHDEDEQCKYFDEEQRYLVGDHFYFGRSKADEHGGIDVIEWRVLRVKSDRLILISDRIIECKAFDDDKKDATWDTSSLRGWLNGEFYRTSFSDEEKSRILDVKNTNPDNEFYGTDGGNATTDKVFCLSIDEAEKYFSGKKVRVDGAMVYSDRIAKPCEYVYEKQKDSPFEKNWWWLRSPGQKDGNAAYIDDAGFICDVGDSASNSNGGVRPVIVIKR